MTSINKSDGLALLKQGFQAVMDEKKKDLFPIYADIGVDLNKDSETIRDNMKLSSTKKWAPHELNTIAYHILSQAPNLGLKWVIDLFRAWGFESSRIAPWVIELIKKRDSTNNQLTNRPFRRSDVPALLTRFSKGILKNARNFSQSRFGLDNLSELFVNSRLSSFSIDPFKSHSDQSSISLFAEDIIYRKGFNAIVGSPGIGKSTLFWYLIGLLIKGNSKGLLPIPIDFLDANSIMDKNGLLRLAIQQAFKVCSETEITTLTQYLDKRLKDGTAFLMIDNCSSSFMRIENICNGWKKVIIFGRYIPLQGYTHISFFRLLELSDQEIRRFVKAWLNACHYQVDRELLLSKLLSSTGVNHLARFPIFLNFICRYFVSKSQFPDGNWQIINPALSNLLLNSEYNDEEVLLCRQLLSVLALSGYTNRDLESGIRRRFYINDVQRYLELFPNNSESQIFNAIIEHGFLRLLQGGDLLSFPYPEFQAALAAEALLREPYWLQFISENRYNAPWHEIIIFSAAQLGSCRDLERLEQLFATISDFDGQLIPEHNILLLCQCMAELDNSVRNQLEFLGVGDLIRKNIVSFLSSNPSCFLYEIGDLLPRMRTDPLINDLIGLLVNRKCHPHTETIIVRALGFMGGSSAIDALSKVALNEQMNYSLRAEAVVALGKSRGTEALPALQSLVQNEAFRPFVVEALVFHNSMDSVNILLSSNELIESWYPSEIAFSNLNTLPLLDKSLKSGYLPVYKYLHAVAAISTDQSIDILERYLYKEETFYLAAKLLSGLLCYRVCDALIRFAEDRRNPINDRSYVLQNLPYDMGLWETRRVCELLFQNTSGLSLKEKLMVDHFVCIDLFVLFGAKIALCRTNNLDLLGELKRLLEKASDYERGVIVYIMAQQKREEFVSLLHTFENDPDEYISKTAIEGLAHLPQILEPEEVIEGLKTAIDKGESIYGFCEAAGELKLEQAVPLLAKTIPNNTYDENILVIEALGNIGGSLALRPLLENKDNLLFDEGSSCIQKLYLQTLARIGEPEGLQVIIDYSTGPLPEKLGLLTNLSELLGQVGNPSAVAFLSKALYHSNADVRYYSMIALSNMGCEKAIPVIVDLLSDDKEWIRDRAYWVITRKYEVIKDPAAIASLANALCHPEHRVRDAALIGLRSVPPHAIISAIRMQIRKIIETEPLNYLFDEAVRTYSEIGGAGTARYFWRLLAAGFSESASSEMGKYRMETILFAIRGIKFLPFLIEQLPETRSLINRLCERHGFRVLPNKNILLPEGQELSANRAVKWLMMREKQQELVPKST
jgi:energy-coupling factor transporter ATP-binding protein EcfA2